MKEFLHRQQETYKQAEQAVQRRFVPSVPIFEASQLITLEEYKKEERFKAIVKGVVMDGEMETIPAQQILFREESQIIETATPHGYDKITDSRTQEIPNAEIVAENPNTQPELEPIQTIKLSQIPDKTARDVDDELVKFLRFGTALSERVIIGFEFVEDSDEPQARIHTATRTDLGFTNMVEVKIEQFNVELPEDEIFRLSAD